MRSQWGRRWAHVAIMVGAVAWLAASVCRLVGLRVNVSPSLPVGIYRETRAPVRVGSFVEACLPPSIGAWAVARKYLWRGPCPGGMGAAMVGKMVVATAGDTADLGDDGVTVNGVRLPHSRPLSVDALQRRLPRVRGRWVLGPKEVWLYGSGDSRSLDSRYFGPVTRDVLRATLSRVWIMPGAFGRTVTDERLW